MHSAAAVNTHFFLPPNSLLPCPSPRAFPVYRSRVAVVIGGGGCGGKDQEKASNFLSRHCAAPLKEQGTLLGFLDARKRNIRDSCWEFDDGFVRRCSKDWGPEGDSALEAEILEFMKNSENPELFPSKKQLIDAGRTDLVAGVTRLGGWMASGWDLEGDESEAEVVLDWKNTDSESRALLSDEKKVESDQERSHEASPLRDTSYYFASSSGISLETAAVDDSGIDGMLNRLEMERSSNLGFKLPERSKVTHAPSHHPAYDELSTASKTSTVADIKRISEPASLNHSNGRNNDSQDKPDHLRQFTDVDGLENSSKSDGWRIWSEQRAGFSTKDFEACEIDAKETRSGEVVDSEFEVPHMDVEGCSDDANRKKTDQSQAGLGPIATRLQQMESKLSAVLKALKSDTGDIVWHKGSENSSDKHLKHYDAWEFQETDIMSRQNKLRSIRAKIAIVEGRMALAIIDAQRLVEQKQKRIDDAQKGIQLLRKAYIVWPTEASEVFVAGSFDGWATKRKMERSNTSTFSLFINLYPGKYEIKFVVDGKWKVDHLRPVVQHNGYVNNLFIVD